MSREGSVRRDGPRRWLFVIDVTPPGAAKRKQVFRRGFKTKNEALAALEKLRSALRTGGYVEPSKLTVEAFIVDQWLPSLPARVRPTTADTYARLARTHIIPSLGDVLLQQLERAQVARWVAGLSAKGLSAKSVRNVFGVLSAALVSAHELELVPRNVAARLKSLPTAAPRAPRAWTAEQLGGFLDIAARDEFAALWRFVATTGCRRGEALGLRWADVDLEASTATIASQRTIAGGRVVEGAPKTRSGARTVALDVETLDGLRATKAEQNAGRLLMGAGWPRHDLVFTHRDGTPLWPQMVTARFRALAERAELPTIGLHGLRHSAATWMISSGVNPRVVQQRLGHANVSITLALYTHVLPGHDRAAADAFAQALAVRREHPVIVELPIAVNDEVSVVHPLGLEPPRLGDAT